MDKSALGLWTLILQACAFLRLAFLLLDCLRSNQSFQIAVACHRYRAQIRQWWEQKQLADSRSELELDKMRCKWMNVFMCVVFSFSMLRLLQRQIGELLDADSQNYLESQTNHEFDLVVPVMTSIGFVLGFFPCLINPRSLDVWYVVVMVGMDVSYLIPEQQIDVRDMVGFTFAGRFVLSVLAKRTWCVVLCIATNLLTAIQLSRSQEDAPGAAFSIPSLVGTYAMMFLCIIGVRILIRENMLLRKDLQKRTVEMGAVSSLLTACYDAVVEVDHEFKLTHDSNQLSSMLLHAAKPGGLSGKPLLDFFSENDRSRISEQFLSSTRQNLSVVALNADMLDADFNYVKVELFGAQFKNLANEQCFLVAVREMQDLEPASRSGGPRGPRGPSTQSDSLSPGGAYKPELVVIFDVSTFDIYRMDLVDPKLEQLCKASWGEAHPDNILDLASPDSRLSLSQQLQNLGNQLFTSREESMKNFTVNFSLLGLGEATAPVSVEHDQVLDSWKGTMAINLKATSMSSSLTASNLQRLPMDGGGHSIGLRSRRPSSRSSSSRVSRLSSRSSSQRSGAIGELHQQRRPMSL